MHLALYFVFFSRKNVRITNPWQEGAGLLPVGTMHIVLSNASSDCKNFFLGENLPMLDAHQRQ